MPRTNSKLDALTLQDAERYLREQCGDELSAAFALAADRNTLAGCERMPDSMEVHHALFLMRRARGLEAPSFDSVRCSLRMRAA